MKTCECPEHAGKAIPFDEFDVGCLTVMGTPIWSLFCSSYTRARNAKLATEVRSLLALEAEERKRK